MEAGELELAARAAGGDETAFRSIVERYSRMAHTLAYRITGDTTSAEDVVQETFLRVHRAIHRFDGRASMATWIGRIATNAALDVARSRKHRREVPYEVEEGVAEVRPSSEPDPERVAQSGDLRRALARVMPTLTPVERTAFVLRHFEGRHTDEIAEVLGLRSNATRQAVFRAVRKLRQALAPFVEEQHETAR